MNKFDLMTRVKNIISEKEPNQIKSISCNFDILDEEDQEYTYRNLIKYWKLKKSQLPQGNDTTTEDELANEYINIEKLNQDSDLKTSIGVFSLFYFKDNKRFLAVGKYKNELFHFSIKCPQYQKVLSNAMTLKNELFVLTYWIL